MAPRDHSSSELGIDKQEESPTSLPAHSGRHKKPKCCALFSRGESQAQDSEDQIGCRRFCSPFWWILGAVVAIMIFVGLIVGLTLGLRGRATAGYGGNLTVDLGYSKYVGSSLDDGVNTWLGIRFAAPPVGDLRFRAPVDPVPDGITYSATQHSPLCHSAPSASLNPKESEDCLFLDVYAPSSQKLHPVFIFIQGGGFNGLANPNLDGSRLVRAGDHKIVVVTFNYRVGPFGFLASKEVQANGDLNVGLLDQRKVFEWVQENIHQFGGDPDHVTIGGSSAGAGSIALHLTAYGGRDDGLFNAAAAGSPSFGAKLTVEGSQYQYDSLIEHVNCSTSPDTLQCLRNTDIKVIAEHNSNMPMPGGAGGDPVFPYTNVIDYNFTVDYPYQLFADGKFIRVPVIFGDDTNEGTIFTPANIANTNSMNNFLRDNFPKLNDSQLTQVDILWPKAEQFPKKGEYWRAAANAYGEMRYICPGIFISSQYSAFGATTNWNFRWDVLGPNNAESGLGVTHAADLASIWGTSMPPDKALIPTIQSYWTSFIRTYDPNPYKLDEAPQWSPWNVDTMERLHFVNDVGDVALEGVDGSQAERCRWWADQREIVGM